MQRTREYWPPWTRLSFPWMRTDPWINTAPVGSTGWSRGGRVHEAGAGSMEESLVHGGVAFSWSHKISKIYTSVRCCIFYNLRFLIEFTSCITSSSLPRSSFFHSILQAFLRPRCKVDIFGQSGPTSPSFLPPPKIRAIEGTSTEWHPWISVRIHG